jgi:hypothetical protein
MTKDEFVEALLCLGGGASYPDTGLDKVGMLFPRKEWTAWETEQSRQGPNGYYLAGGNGLEVWLRPLEYVARLMNNEVGYPPWVGEDGDE